ncbi:MAG TPA: hypothetical protein VN493_10185 [Thermoanaerobaculia bacterium]|nr:hypothetical protein [Thermoanaerobaculia bacterium]
MSLNLSIAQMVAQLEARVVHHQKLLDLHAGQEAFHHEKVTLHQAELDAAQGHLDAFRAAAVAAGELLERDKSVAPPSPGPADDLDLRRRKSLSRMMARVLEDLPPDQTFGATTVTRAIQERWGAKLRRRPDPRSVATTLRRWALDGRIDQIREGRAHNEGLYRKKREAGSEP